MNLLLPFRRARWLSGALVLVLVAGMLAPLGLRLGGRYWAYYVGVAVLLLLAFAWTERARKAAPRRPPRGRGQLQVLSGGRADPREIDLARDATTEGQRWLM
jgi:hypothetical protein